ncbi:MAG TPA: hypothetical protein VGK84_06160 [Candidatus Tumulicola sp.]
MKEPDRKSPHHEPEQEKLLLGMFSPKAQAVLKERLSQDAFRHFEDALHGKRTATDDQVAEWKRVSGT